MRRVSWNLGNCHATVQKLLVQQVLNKSKLWSWRVTYKGLHKNLKLATFDVESLSRSLVLQPESSRRWVYATLNYTWVVTLKSGKTGRCVADHADVESAYGAFPLNYSFTAAFLHVCVCAAFAITGWVVNRNNNFDRAETARVKMNARLSYTVCLNFCRLLCTCKRNLKYCWFQSLIICQEKSCRRIVLSGNRLVGEHRSGKRPVGKTCGYRWANVDGRWCRLLC